LNKRPTPVVESDQIGEGAADINRNEDHVLPLVRWS
jgi:hypothetical protein